MKESNLKKASERLTLLKIRKSIEDIISGFFLEPDDEELMPNIETSISEFLKQYLNDNYKVTVRRKSFDDANWLEKVFFDYNERQIFVEVYVKPSKEQDVIQMKGEIK